jgi:hypothetical protein
MSTDDTQVYVTGVLYQQSAYPSNIDLLVSLVDDAFRQILGLKYSELLVNRSECRFSNTTTREQLLLFLKDVSFNDVKFISDSQSTSMRTAIINKLNELSDIEYDNVEIRTTRFV